MNIGNGASGYGTINAAAFTVSSDVTLKKNIVTLTNPLDKILGLRGVSFQWKNDGKKDIGFIAQEVEKTLPELVHINDTGTKSVEYMNITAVLVEAMKELSHKYYLHDEKIKKLESENETLKKRLDALEAKMK